MLVLKTDKRSENLESVISFTVTYKIRAVLEYGLENVAWIYPCRYKKDLSIVLCNILNG